MKCLLSTRSLMSSGIKKISAKCLPISLPGSIYSAQFSSSTKLQQPQKVQLLNDKYTINYEKVGKGPQTILCLPGVLGFIQTDFGPQLKKLDKDKFTIVVWDPPGYGQSRPPDRDFSGNYFNRDAHVAAALMQNLGHQKYSVLGWSQGGCTGLHLALDFPTSVEKLVVWGAHAFMDEKTMDNAELMDVMNWPKELVAALIQVYGEQYLKQLVDGWLNGMSRFYHQHGGDLGYTSRLGEIKCPTLVLNGSEDPVTKGTYHAEYIHKHIKGSELVIIPKGKHNIHLRGADEFNALVSAFLLK